jgi:hypothetical protein
VKTGRGSVPSLILKLLANKTGSVGTSLAAPLRSAAMIPGLSLSLGGRHLHRSTEDRETTIRTVATSSIKTLKGLKTMS